MKRPDFPLWVDSTAIANIKACQLKAYWAHIRKIELQSTSIHLTAGGAVAKGIEAARRAFYEQDKPAKDAVGEGLIALWKTYGNPELAEKDTKTWLAVSQALVYYFDVFPLGIDALKPAKFGNSFAIEFSFSIPLSVKHPISGDPIMLTGRADMIAHYRDLLLCVDEKTTGKLGPLWAEQWRLRGQFMAYTYAARWYDRPVDGTLVRGLRIGTKEILHAEAIIYHTDEILTAWWKSINVTVENLVTAWEDNYYIPDFASACANYGGCEFLRLCESPNPEDWVEAYYRPRNWNPLNTQEVV